MLVMGSGEVGGEWIVTYRGREGKRLDSDCVRVGGMSECAPFQ